MGMMQLKFMGYPIPSTPAHMSTPELRPTQMPVTLPEGVESYEQGALPKGNCLHT